MSKSQEKLDEQEKLPESESEANTDTTKEINGRQGLEPTRYGDWEKNGRCIDF